MFSALWVPFLTALAVSALVPTRTEFSRRWDTVPNSPFVSTQDGQFYVNGSVFNFIGTNAYWLSSLNTDQDINNTLASIRAANFTVVRTWAFNGIFSNRLLCVDHKKVLKSQLDVDTIPENGTWFQLINNGTLSINNGTNGLQKLDKVIELAQQNGLYVLMSLTNNWNPLPGNDTNTTSPIQARQLAGSATTTSNTTLPRNYLSNSYGGMDAYVRNFGGPQEHDQFYTNQTLIDAFMNYTTQIVSRYVNNTNVFGWELANDPRCNSTLPASAGCVAQNITRWHSVIAQHVAQVDPNHLVSSGNQGFFCTDCPKLFPIKTTPAPQPSPAPGSHRRSLPEPQSKAKLLKERKAAWKKERERQKRAGVQADGVQIRGRWTATQTKRQSDLSSASSAFDGSQGVDSEDILNIPDIGFGSFQLFPDQFDYNQNAPDPSLPAFNQTLQAGLEWIQLQANLGKLLNKPVSLTGFGLVTQSNAASFVPFNSTVAPFAADSSTTTNVTQSYGVTDDQRDDAYSQWIQGYVAGVLGGLQGMIQYQARIFCHIQFEPQLIRVANLTAEDGTAITSTSTTTSETGQTTTTDTTGTSPNDGYGILGQGLRGADCLSFYPTRRKLIYCSRTVPEIEKALAELKRLMAYRISQAETDEEREKEKNYSGLGLTSRKNLCIHPEVSKEKKGKVVDARCRDMTNSAACEKGRADPGSVELCDWHENLGKLEPGNLIPAGIWTLADVLQYGRDKGICPYFTVRRMMPFVDIIIYSFHYLLDPKVAEQVSKELSKDAIVVFDEAHNIDNVCIESLSIDLTRPMLDSAARSVTRLGEKIEEIKTTDAAKLQDEYAKLVEGLQDAVDDTDSFMANPLLPDDLLNEAVPGNIRKAEHFVAFLKRFVEYLKTRMRVLHVVAETPLSFLQHLKDITYIERRPLRFCAERLQSLIRTLNINRLDEYSALQKVASFATLVSTYEKVFERFSSVVITSGTISPLDMYPKMLQFTPVVQETYPMTLTRNAFLPLVITRGGDQVAISSRFEVRNDPAVVRNFGSILIEYSKIVPDGIVAFFPSYLYMESIVAAWNDMGILNEVWKHKLIFVETPDANETSIALENYRRACDNGRGAVLLSVARGKVSEGIDFDHNYGRAVIMFGYSIFSSLKIMTHLAKTSVPYQYTESRILKARLEYLRDAYRIRESEFLGFDAMRNAAQCVGRVLRGKTDWGLMVFADKRFARADKRAKLPRWINQYITETASNLSTDMALTLSKLFMRSISQNPNENQTGVSLWTLEDVEKAQAKQKALAQAQAENNEEDDYGDGGIDDQMLVDFDLEV
ncbi:hypothetical protein H0H92_010924 [Tricholoma furcatifolium]|nr:hypothetical protein H0H92_010924 [Tricholoma furcatifolium]